MSAYRSDERSSAKTNTSSLADKAIAVGQSAYDEGKHLVESAGELASTASRKMKSMGVDTDAIVDTAKDGASELQKRIFAKVRQRPFEAIALAAFLGFLIGIRFRSE